jgi:hypothetical protein
MTKIAKQIDEIAWVCLRLSWDIDELEARQR